MPEYARIVGGKIVERRTLESIPPHKAALWTPIVVEGSGPIVQTIIEAEQVRDVHSEVPLHDAQADYLRRIDEDAERIRLRYVTPGAGMAMTYQEKFAQAQAVDALGQAPANALTAEQYGAQYPTLAASVGLEAGTLWDCAQLVIARYEAFAALSGVIEHARLAGKIAVSNAADVAAARAAYEAITWPSP